MLKVENLSVMLGEFSLKNISFGVEQGDYFVLLGPSGSGKSILLETIAGIRPAHSGAIVMHGQNITTRSAGKRNIGLVFQDNTVFPHMNVRNNIRYGLKLKINNKTGIETKLRQLSQSLLLDNLLDRSPVSLSGGELQRVLLARTLASDPEILLLDEPLSSVDTLQKDTLKELLRSLNSQGQTIIHVTHDYEEAISLAHHVGVMNKGKLLAAGRARDVFENPGNEFIARFCGYKNFFRAVPQGDGAVMINDCVSIDLPGRALPQNQISILIKCHDIGITLQKTNQESLNTFSGKLLHTAPSASGLDITVDIGIRLTATLYRPSEQEKNLQPGTEVQVHIPESAIKIIG